MKNIVAFAAEAKPDDPRSGNGRNRAGNLLPQCNPGSFNLNPRDFRLNLFFY